MIEEKQSMQICDINYLEEVASGDRVFMGEIIAVFLKQVPVELEKMQETLAAKNMQQVRQIAHKLKSTVSVVGAESMRIDLQQIEELAPLETQTHKIIQLYHELVEKSKIAIEELTLFQLDA